MVLYGLALFGGRLVKVVSYSKATKFPESEKAEVIYTMFMLLYYRSYTGNSLKLPVIQMILRFCQLISNNGM